MLSLIACGARIAALEIARDLAIFDPTKTARLHLRALFSEQHDTVCWALLSYQLGVLFTIGSDISKDESMLTRAKDERVRECGNGFRLVREMD